MPPSREVTDANRELEKNDERHQVLLVDTKDATLAQRSDPFVIVTDSANETWDATPAKGISSIYAIRGFKGSSTTGTCIYVHHQLGCMMMCIYAYICLYTIYPYSNVFMYI